MKRTWKDSPRLTHHLDLAYSDEQEQRISALMALWGMKKRATIRRCIDETFVREVLSNSSNDTTQSNELGK